MFRFNFRMSIEVLKRKRNCTNYASATSNLDEKENQNSLISPYFKKENQKTMNSHERDKLSFIKNENNGENASTSKFSNLREPENVLKSDKSNDLPSNYDDGDVKINAKKVKWEPNEWMKQLDMIKEMRSNQNAPVDTMGCDSNLDDNLPPNIRRFHILISLMLSSQTKDEITNKAMIELKKLPLDIDTILATNQEKIAQTIYPVSFYKRKAQYIHKTCELLKEKFNYDIPDSIDELCALPGVGPKMAYLAMSSGWNKTVGIGVDTHVHRISNRLGWTKTKTPEHTRKELEDWLPQDYWNEVNHLLVGFGQTICKPIGPKCDICLCKDICPTGKKEIKKFPKRGKKIEVSDE